MKGLISFICRQEGRHLVAWLNEGAAKRVPVGLLGWEAKVSYVAVVTIATSLFLLCAIRFWGYC
jgi:hypothetical protein